jgi:acetylornithine/succinyldiaminopimelate/putrescine aminotransferase
MHPADSLASLHAMRAATGEARTVGLQDSVILDFLQRDATLGRAIAEGYAAFLDLQRERPDLLQHDEDALIACVQEEFVNFYPTDAINPYVALAARGPWIVTLYGAVVHDNGGYGMMGMGHAPDAVLAAMSRPWVMANIMTPSLSQIRFIDAIEAELGHARADGNPFDKVVCLNSGSEAMTAACRIADVLARKQTDPGGRHAGKRRMYLGIERAFHGRTDRPAQLSHSTHPTYKRNLASFRDLDNLWVVPANDVLALEAAFRRADAEGVYIEMVVMEPVQGEGSPGQAMSRAFYDVARRLTLEHGTFLVVDSIQAGLRAWGTLSIVDYPGFTDAAPPDMESWSKAINAGQYPLSVLGLTHRAADHYVKGIYGNTMTTNPRALEVACAVLSQITPELRQNIREQGCNFVGDLRALQARFPHLIVDVQGTGLLFCCELAPDKARAIGPGSAEERLRLRGVGVIHGGKNALRFTPHFAITDHERRMVMEHLGEVLAEIDAELHQAATQPAAK